MGEAAAEGDATAGVDDAADAGDVVHIKKHEPSARTQTACS